MRREAFSFPVHPSPPASRAARRSHRRAPRDRVAEAASQRGRREIVVQQGQPRRWHATSCRTWRMAIRVLRGQRTGAARTIVTTTPRVGFVANRRHSMRRNDKWNSVKSVKGRRWEAPTHSSAWTGFPVGKFCQRRMRGTSGTSLRWVSETPRTEQSSQKTQRRFIASSNVRVSPLSPTRHLTLDAESKRIATVPNLSSKNPYVINSPFSLCNLRCEIKLR